MPGCEEEDHTKRVLLSALVSQLLHQREFHRLDGLAFSDVLYRSLLDDNKEGARLPESLDNPGKILEVLEKLEREGVISRRESSYVITPLAKKYIGKAVYTD